ncbi:hypothetical protein A2954_06710 [Candidatus Roizmanbacteria bacterium RIFCSPLOWO2_01_FULL_37_12]|uniref:PIN domain-containing protein n=1 Tax=Candidatus Roizmanbacteria bacterium RIFCSPLOWO2_01_FULL_37_12 TaxID=1802056 RepID=A0A1F7I981_9BACT|nr:MAG: hypothetical protein A2768_01835 [Candidatus Roizmanbacteria bacterium RIFCSPHIGHO2_01_FULL_37_16]OGK25718.1 MAG: hypothetical protein A3D76_04890 [Candidatus Roizmanbacteria bacterium RIFCSPHIGHO2_02_FULL_37_9b]OGK39921.1 MAG: hypothetical protein A2954_06710 [Candidatus Roizmanbacteria bacterium RIFCSPLOWO2_01_FULL_37_12]
MKLFLDANVLYSASRSRLGASFGIFLLKNRYKIKLFSSQLALVEAERNISEKEEAFVIKNFYELIIEIKIVSVDKNKANQFYGKIIEEKDSPILFGAHQIKANFLITLDKKHFFTEKLKKEKLSFKIMSPGQFIMTLKKT